MSRPALLCGDTTLALGERTFVMGVLNLTPDSFSDGGSFMDDGQGRSDELVVELAVEHAKQLLSAGADVLDIGGESTRPGAAPVPPDVEQARVLPVIRALAAGGVKNISIDTRNASTARASRDAGAAWLNDVTALTWDDEM